MDWDLNNYSKDKLLTQDNMGHKIRDSMDTKQQGYFQKSTPLRGLNKNIRNYHL